MAHLIAWLRHTAHAAKQLVERLVPECPLRLGTLIPNADTNQSAKLDYLSVARGGDTVLLVERKTDDRSGGTRQGRYLERAQEVGLSALFRGLAQIVQTTAYRRKYRYLVQKLEELGLVATAADDRLNVMVAGRDLRVIILQPRQGDRGDATGPTRQHHGGAARAFAGEQAW